MTSRYRRNQLFKRDLPKYRFAMRKWMTRGETRRSVAMVSRYTRVLQLEAMILNWELHENFITRFFIEPPDKLIQEVITWE